MKRPGVITGLIREAECLDVFPADQRPTVACSGARSDQAALLAREMIAKGCQGLVSFGTAGGLTAALGPGAVVIAESVAAPEGPVFETSATWRGRVLESLGDEAGVTMAAVAGADGVVATADAKRALARKTSAVAVDMESHAAATVAAESGVPFLVVRVIADPLERPIPV
ncbi:MAG: nucleoside phosphorylase, partial [Rhodospirillales bacterium]